MLLVKCKGERQGRTSSLVTRKLCSGDCPWDGCDCILRPSPLSSLSTPLCFEPGKELGGPLYVVTSPVPPSSASSSTCSRFDLSITQTPRRTRMQGCWGRRRPAGHACPLRPVSGRLLLHSQPFLLLLPLRGVSDAFAS